MKVKLVERFETTSASGTEAVRLLMLATSRFDVVQLDQDADKATERYALATVAQNGGNSVNDERTRLVQSSVCDILRVRNRIFGSPAPFLAPLRERYWGCFEGTGASEPGAEPDDTPAPQDRTAERVSWDAARLLVLDPSEREKLIRESESDARLELVGKHLDDLRGRYLRTARGLDGDLDVDDATPGLSALDATPVAPAAPTSGARLADAVACVTPSVVRVWPRKPPAEGIDRGSGIVLPGTYCLRGAEEQAYRVIATNSHVIYGQSEVDVGLSDGRVVTAKSLWQWWEDVGVGFDW